MGEKKTNKTGSSKKFKKPSAHEHGWSRFDDDGYGIKVIQPAKGSKDNK